MKLYLRLALLFRIVYTLVAAANAEIDGEESVKLLPPTPDMEDAVSKALKGCAPHRNAPGGDVNKNGVYTLDGELFQKGHSYAVIDHDPLLIAEWKDKQWKVKAALDVAPVWKYQDWDSSTAQGREPEATRPFWTITLQHQALLVVASDVEKAGQGYRVILFDGGLNRILDSAFSLRTPPGVEAGYLHTRDASRVKATWEADYFSQIEKRKFVLVKSWMENNPYDQPEPPDFDGDVCCYEARSGSNGYTITPDYRKEGHPDDYLVFKGELGLDGWRSIFEAWKTNKIIAKVSFVPKSKPVPDMPEAETAYLFEKLTSLPRKLYRLSAGITLPEGVESMATVKVSGDPEAVKLLSPASTKANSRRWWPWK